ncbi:hypothetical protein BURKHO8Y_160093 [Burkholderia sp. 8Y]|nr:hypothetical protein BURKHO8Y_160093 [Burkholderia sp. 8Y]
MKACFVRAQRIRARRLLGARIAGAARTVTCGSRGRHGQRDQPYQANYQSSRQFSHKKLLSERNPNITPPISPYKIGAD